MPDAVMVAVVLGAALVASTYIFSRTLAKLNIVIATSGAAESAAVSDEDLERLRQELEGNASLNSNEPAAQGQWTYESAASVLDAEV